MEEYFNSRFEYLDSKIQSWNGKNFFQRLFTSEKWSNEDTCNEVEKIFQIGNNNSVKSREDFNVYMKYFIKYHTVLSDELANNIIDRLLISDYLSPQVESLLEQFQKASLMKQKHNNQAMDIINSLKK